MHAFPFRLPIILFLALATLAGATADSSAALVASVGKAHRHRANVLVIGDTLAPGVVARLQEIMADDANIFQPTRPVGDLDEVAGVLDGWLMAQKWDAIFVGVGPGANSSDEEPLKRMVARLKEQHILIAWGGVPAMTAGLTNNEAVRRNDLVRKVMRAEHVPFVDLYGALLTQTASSGRDAGAAMSVCADTMAGALRRLLLNKSTPWAELPLAETRDPARLLADPQLLASPDNLPLAQGDTATIYRAEAGGWQFNLHSFIAHHDGRFWAVRSSGRVDEDSSSQFIRYATSVDGKTWSESEILAPDPDGEAGPWYWMASGIYEEAGRLFALGSLNRGKRDGQIWSDVHLVRFEWVDGAWKEDRLIAENCAVYFPPLKVAGRDFFVWRDSYAHFFTAYGTMGGAWEVTRLPGPLPTYRMSETSAYVDPQGVVHLIIRDQGETRRIYHSLSYDAGATWTLPVKTNYPDATSKNCSGRLSNGWYYLINNPKAEGANERDPLAVSFSSDGWVFGAPMALCKNGPPLRYPGRAKGPYSFQYSHAIEHDGRLWVIYAINKEDIAVSSFDLAQFGLKK